jgi:uncharacterized phiE125 gp8 family phage protein
MWSIHEVTPPVQEPMTVLEARLALRIDHSDEDAELARMVTAARQQVEKDTSHLIATATYDLYADEIPSDGVLDFPRQPLSRVISVTVFDGDDLDTVVDESYYHVDVGSNPPRVLMLIDYDAEWLPDWPRSYQVIAVRFVGGPDEGEPSPPWAVQAMVQLMRYWRTKDEQEFKAYERLIEGRAPVGVA